MLYWLLGLSDWVLQKWCRQGKIPAKKIEGGRHWIVHIPSLVTSPHPRIRELGLAALVKMTTRSDDAFDIAGDDEFEEEG